MLDLVQQQSEYELAFLEPHGIIVWHRDYNVSTPLLARAVGNAHYFGDRQ